MLKKSSGTAVIQVLSVPVETESCDLFHMLIKYFSLLHAYYQERSDIYLCKSQLT